MIVGGVTSQNIGRVGTIYLWRKILRTDVSVGVIVRPIRTQVKTLVLNVKVFLGQSTGPLFQVKIKRFCQPERYEVSDVRR